MKIGILLLCGLPGAGKTTTVSYLKSACPVGYQFIHVCYDNLIEHIDHSKDIHGWKNARSRIVFHVNLLVCQLLNTSSKSNIGVCHDTERMTSSCTEKDICFSGLQSMYNDANNASGHDYIIFAIDDNMQYRGMRYEYFKLCREHSISFGIVYFDTPSSVCIDRNLQRPQPVSLDVIKRLAIQMEVPGTLKADWEQHICILTESDTRSAKDTQRKILDIITHMIDHPVIKQLSDNTASEISRNETRKCFMHQADLCMRKFVSTQINLAKDSKTSNIKVLSQKLNSAKKALHAYLKMGYIDESCYVDKFNSIDLSALETKVFAMMSSEMA